MKDGQVIGYSPEIIALLRQLQKRITIMLQMTPSSLPSGSGTGTIDPRFDIIIGDVGIKDLSKVPNPDWIDAPNPVLGLLPAVTGKTVPIIHKKSSSLPGTDQWPNVAKEREPADLEQLYLDWLAALDSDQIKKVDDLDAFKAGYEEGRKAS